MYTPRRFACYVVACCLCLIGLAGIHWRRDIQNHALTTAYVEAMLFRSLPPGTKKTAVVAFLEHNKIEYAPQSEREIGAIIRDVSSGVVQSSIHIAFVFDRRDNLTRDDVRYVYTGL